jgi:hypothetical protein
MRQGQQRQNKHSNDMPANAAIMTIKIGMGPAAQQSSDYIDDHIVSRPIRP